MTLFAHVVPNRREAIRDHSRGKRYEGEQSLNTLWNVREEARAFFRLVQRGTMTLEEAESSIRMPATVLTSLVREYPHDEAMIEKIYYRREITWEAFLTLCVGDIHAS